MTGFGGVGFNGGHARGAHLALINGGASDKVATARAAEGELRLASVNKTADVQAKNQTAWRGASSSIEGSRSNHEQGVRAIAKNFANFEEALLPMVLASGVSGEAASSVAAAIRSNPALLAQAERAFQRARIEPA